MKEVSVTKTTKTAFGRTLENPISYSYKFSAYENFPEVRAANDTLTDDEEVKVRNDERDAKARAAAWKAALDLAGIVKPNLENDEQFRLREMVKILLLNKAKYPTEESARAKAAEELGIAWEDED